MQATVPHPVDLFTAVLETTGGEIERINEPRQVASAIAKIVQGQGAREVLYEMTDMAEEMTNFTRDQIMMESNTAMLAQANQSPLSILKLLGG